MVSEAQQEKTEALEMLEASFDEVTSLSGSDQPATLGALAHLGNAWLDQEMYDKAEHAFRQCISHYQMAVGADHPLTLVAMERLVWLIMARQTHGKD